MIIALNDQATCLSQQLACDMLIYYSAVVECISISRVHLVDYHGMNLNALQIARGTVYLALPICY